MQGKKKSCLLYNEHIYTYFNLFHISACFDCHVSIKMFNNAQAQASRAGIYKATTPVNGKAAWIQNTGNNAIWNAGSFWVIGAASDIGTGYAGLYSSDNADCPQDVAGWSVWDGAWLSAASSDVTFECYEFNGKNNIKIKIDIVCRR